MEPRTQAPGVGVRAKVTPGSLVKARPPPPRRPPWERRPSRSGGERYRKRKPVTRPSWHEGGAARPLPSPQASWEHEQPQGCPGCRGLGLPPPVDQEGPARVLPASPSSSRGLASQTAPAWRPETTRRKEALQCALPRQGRAQISGGVGGGCPAHTGRAACLCGGLWGTLPQPFTMRPASTVGTSVSLLPSPTPNSCSFPELSRLGEEGRG